MPYSVVTAAVKMGHVTYDSSIKQIIYPLLDIKLENISKMFTQFYDLMECQLIKGNTLVDCAEGIPE